MHTVPGSVNMRHAKAPRTRPKALASAEGRVLGDLADLDGRSWTKSVAAEVEKLIPVACAATAR
ncbi:hypothetical protein GCM10010411_93880 [Actinomadura fulvescens]|uniref:Uncharacterized protein n=1 Tax=Actinomadura fulvescens TaxID=46160 RepID=A0ABP6D9I4_9ACTN